MPPLRTSAAALAALTLLAACSSSSPKHLGAAEPATAPAPGAAPAGVSVRVGDEPEGIVYDPVTKLVAVAVRNPDRLQLLDPTTLKSRRDVPLPGSVRHLQLARPGGPVLVPDESARQLVQVALPGGSITLTDVEKQPHDAAQSGADVVVGNEFGKSISIVRNGKVRATVRDLKQPGGVIGDGNTVAVVDVGAFTLSTYDLTTLKRTGRVAAGAGPTHGVLLSGGRVLVTDTRGGALLVFTLSPLKRVARLATPGAPYGIAYDATTGTAWVTLTARNQLIGVDVTGPTPRVVARYDTVQQPNTVAVEPGSHRLWVTGTTGGVVERIDR